MPSPALLIPRRVQTYEELCPTAILADDIVTRKTKMILLDMIKKLNPVASTSKIPH